MQEQFKVHMNGSGTNWKILPSPSEKNLPLSEDNFPIEIKVKLG